MAHRYHVERVRSTDTPSGWDYELRDRLNGTNAEPLGYFTDLLMAEKIAALLNTVQVVHEKTTPALARAARRVLEHV